MADSCALQSGVRSGVAAREACATWNDPECDSTIQSPQRAITGPSGVRTCTAALSTTAQASSPSQRQSARQLALSLGGGTRSAAP